MIRFEREFTKFQKMGTFTKEGKMGYGDVLVTIGFVPFCLRLATDPLPLFQALTGKPFLYQRHYLQVLDRLLSSVSSRP